MAERKKNTSNKPDSRRGSIKFKMKSSGGKNNQSKKKINNAQWQRGGRTAVVWLLFFIGMLIFYQLMNSMPFENEHKLTYMEYRMFLESGSGFEFRGDRVKQATH